MTTDKSYISGLAEYAQWLEKHPELQHRCEISIYSAKPEEVAILIASGATIDTLPNTASISYVTMNFGILTVKYVVNKKDIMVPAIQNGDVVWTLKPEFAGELAVAQ